MKPSSPLVVYALIAGLAGLPALAGAQAVEVARAEASTKPRVVALPGELQPYQAVDIYARVQGYVDTVLVDRGSVVKKGQLLATLVAPELAAQAAEAESKVQGAESQRAEAEARLAAARATWERLKEASSTPGAVAGVELLQAEKAAEAAAAAVQSSVRAVQAAKGAADAVKAIAGYLQIAAPFSGVVTMRAVHPGALVGPASREPLLRLEQTARLRLIVPMPESHVGSVVKGRRADFKVSAYPDRAFSATVARIGGSLDLKTRAMPLELDVDNTSGVLQPGMYAEVSWQLTSPASAVLVPASAVVTTTERTFVIRVNEGKAQWVTVRKGPANGALVEITGALKVGDPVVRRATDEIREGTPIDTTAGSGSAR